MGHRPSTSPSSPDGAAAGAIRACARCGEAKPLDAEHWHRQGDGYQRYCRPCMIEYNRRQRAAHIETRRRNDRIAKRYSRLVYGYCGYPAKHPELARLPDGPIYREHSLRRRPAPLANRWELP